MISGAKGRVEAVCAGAKEFGAKIAKLLPVSAPFHSSLMLPAAERMAEALGDANIQAPAATLVANVTANETKSPDEIRDLLVKQVTGRVRWTESVGYMADQGCDLMVEVGSGKVLSGLIRRINRDVKTANVGEPGDVEGYATL